MVQVEVFCIVTPCSFAEGLPEYKVTKVPRNTVRRHKKESLDADLHRRSKSKDKVLLVL